MHMRQHAFRELLPIASLIMECNKEYGVYLVSEFSGIVLAWQSGAESAWVRVRVRREGGRRAGACSRVVSCRGRGRGRGPRVVSSRSLSRWRWLVGAAAALRSRGLAVLRYPRARRPSILGRDGFFVRYGDRERAACADFDFLDQLSGGSSPEATKDCT